MPWTSCFTSLCPGSTPGCGVVMRGQGDRQQGFSHGAGGRGHERKAKGYAGLTCILKRHQLQIPLPATLCQAPSRLIKLPCDPKTLLSAENLGGRILHILILPSKAARLYINCFCHFWRAKVDRRRELSFQCGQVSKKIGA